METILRTKDLKKYYGTGETVVKALDGIDLSIGKGSFTAIVGTSGSGKSTLLDLSLIHIVAVLGDRTAVHRAGGNHLFQGSF